MDKSIYDRRISNNLVTEDVTLDALPIVVDWQGAIVNNVGDPLTPTNAPTNAEGKKFLAAGTVLFMNANGEWERLNTADMTTPPERFSILQRGTDLTGQTLPVLTPVFLALRAYDKNMPSAADVNTLGLEASVRSAMIATGRFDFKSDGA